VGSRRLGANHIQLGTENGEVIKTTHQTEIPLNSCAKPIPLTEVRQGRFE